MLFHIFGAISLTLLMSFDALAAKPVKMITLTAVSPISAPVGTEVLLTGRNFGAKQGTVFFGQTVAQVLAWKSRSIRTIVPESLQPGLTLVSIETAERVSNALSFKVLGVDLWLSTSSAGVPIPRWFHSGVWTGSEMVIFGGDPGTAPIFFGGVNGGLNSGGRYNPTTDTWLPTSAVGAPQIRLRHSAVWTGERMIVWGGYNGLEESSGGIYNPASDSWSTVSGAGAPSARHDHTAVWTGSQMIVWGGYDNTATFTFPDTGPRGGGRYNPLTDSWQATSITGAPTARYGHSAIWADNQMIVWGGDDFLSYRSDGFFYNPLTDIWSPLPTLGGPSDRYGHSAIWTGTAMLIWGGETNRSAPVPVNTGALFDPATEIWTSIAVANAPSARSFHRAVWTGTRMLVWGGIETHGVTDGFIFDPLGDGGAFNVAANSWASLSNEAAPAPRYFHTAVWDGEKLIVWGGHNGVAAVNTGGRYYPP